MMDPTTSRRFAEFDLAHPEVWTEFNRLALHLIDRGVEHYSADAILHVIRFETSLRMGRRFKLNNDITPYFARKFLAAHPQHAEFFAIRASRVDGMETAA